LVSAASVATGSAVSGATSLGVSSSATAAGAATSLVSLSPLPALLTLRFKPAMKLLGTGEVEGLTAVGSASSESDLTSSTFFSLAPNPKKLDFRFSLGLGATASLGDSTAVSSVAAAGETSLGASAAGSAAATTASTLSSIFSSTGALGTGLLSRLWKNERMSLLGEVGVLRSSFFSSAAAGMSMAGAVSGTLSAADSVSAVGVTASTSLPFSVEASSFLGAPKREKNDWRFFLVSGRVSSGLASSSAGLVPATASVAGESTILVSQYPQTPRFGLRSKLTTRGRGSGDLGGVGPGGLLSCNLLLLLLGLLLLVQERNVESGDPLILLGLGALHIGLVLGGLLVRGHSSLRDNGIGLALLGRGPGLLGCLLVLLLRGGGLQESNGLG